MNSFDNVTRLIEPVQVIHADLEYRNVVKNLTDQESLGEFIGLVAGDGGLHHGVRKGNYKVRIYLGIHQNRLKDKVFCLFRQLFGVIPRIYDEREWKHASNVISVEIESKVIFELIRDYLVWSPHGRRCHTVGLRPNPTKLSMRFIKGFVRGLIESDGWILETQVGSTSASEKLAKDFVYGVRRLGYRCSFSQFRDRRESRALIYHAYITGELQAQRFLRQLSPVKS